MRRLSMLAVAVIFSAMTFTCVNFENFDEVDGPETTTLQAGNLSGFVIKDIEGAPAITRSAVLAEQPPGTEVVAGAMVEIEDTDLVAISNETGWFEINGAPPGIVNILATADINGNGEDEYSLRLDGVEIPRDNGLHLGWLLLKNRTGEIAGTITLEWEMSTNMGIFVFIPGTSYVAITDEAGNYKINWVPQETYDVAAMKNDYCIQIVENVTVEIKTTTSGVDMVLPYCAATGDISGQAYLSEQTDNSGILVEVLDTPLTATTDEDGSWTITDMPVGVYQVKFSSDEYLPVTVDNVIVVEGVGAYIVDTVNLIPVWLHNIEGYIIVPEGYQAEVLTVAPEGLRYNDVSVTPWGEVIVPLVAESRVPCESFVASISPTGSISVFADVCQDNPVSVAFGPDTGDLMYFAELGGYWDHVYTIPSYGEPSEVRLIASGFIVPSDIEFSLDGDLYVTDPWTGKIYVIDPDGNKSVFMDGFPPHNSGGNKKTLGFEMAFDSQGTMFLSDSDMETIYRVTTDGDIGTFISDSSRYPASMDFAPNGDLYVADIVIGEIYAITPDAVGSVFATGFTTITDVAIAPDGTLYVLEWLDWPYTWTRSRVIKISETSIEE